MSDINQYAGQKPLTDIWAASVITRAQLLYIYCSFISFGDPSPCFYEKIVSSQSIISMVFTFLFIFYGVMYNI